tara:strand:+ start:254 stop:526 length:273 start_codon:yes stop_codon:yes gene_type:complete
VTENAPLLSVVAVPVVPSPVLVAVTVAPEMAVPSKYVTVPSMFPVAAKAVYGCANQIKPITVISNIAHLALIVSAVIYIALPISTLTLLA